jgi:DNA-binding response OmpR family regulator
MSTKSHILLVDDESSILDNLAPFLERAGFEVSTSQNGKQALDVINREEIDLVVSDVLMPVMDGRELLRSLRQENNWIPVILLTQVGEAFERAVALEEGADDYINKPFEPHELTARVKAVLRRAKPDTPPLTAAWQLSCGELDFDRRSRRAYLNKEEITLTPKAMVLLEYLMTHPDELVSRERLLDVVWGWDYPVGSRAVDTRVAEIRKVLGDDASNPRYIETIPGQGYRFASDVEGN